MNATQTPTDSRKGETAHDDSTGYVPNDARLVEDARQGDDEAFKDLVLRYERRLIGTIYQLVRDRDLAEDLAQETFLRVLGSIDQFDTSRRFGPWLLRIGVNITVDYLRKQKRRGRWYQFSQSATGDWPDPSVADPRRQKDIQQEVQIVIDEIPEKYRQVLVLRDIENFSTSDIAAILDRKEATIRWRLSEARTQFAELWMQRQASQKEIAV